MIVLKKCVLCWLRCEFIFFPNFEFSFYAKLKFERIYLGKNIIVFWQKESYAFNVLSVCFIAVNYKFTHDFSELFNSILSKKKSLVSIKQLHIKAHV